MRTKENNFYTIYGNCGSPYSMKMLAVMRYRRIPHVWKGSGPEIDHARKQVKASVIPVFKYPDGTFANDSTPLIYDLEERHLNGRSIIPERESDAFLAFLIEDLADELLSKAMYHYRWFDERHVKQVSEWLVFDFLEGSGQEKIESFAKTVRDIQRSRLAFVGSSEHNRPMLEHISNLFLDALESHVPDRWFLFGSRPSLADFGLFGQLSQYQIDPAVVDHARQRAPYTFRWVLHMHDLSGFEGNWRPDEEPLPGAIEKLLQIAGEFYFPFLFANEAASAAGEKEFSFEAGGMPYTQGVFKYQVKCLADLRQSYTVLSQGAKDELSEILHTTGCLSYLQAAGP